MRIIRRICNLNDGTQVSVYEVTFYTNEKEDEEKVKKAESFASYTSGQTYKRSGMNNKEHKKNILIGKLAETAFAGLMEQFFNQKLEVNYKNEVDKYDFLLNGIYRVDIKSSSLRTKQKTYSLEDALLHLNFTVLEDQSLKDIIVQALYPSRDYFFKFYFSKWACVKDVLKYCDNQTRFIKMNGNSGKYYLMPLHKGKDIDLIKQASCI
ncbi:MAG: hypothetical protein QW140_03065 [Candidatus Aenigmatarchaeota archaeon]